LQPVGVSWEDERSGVLVVRVWLEGTSRGGLRARISGSASTGTADEPIAIAATPEAITAAVRGWLEGFMASGRVDFWQLLIDLDDGQVTQR
jgi:hypothetical protein